MGSDEREQGRTEDLDRELFLAAVRAAAEEYLDEGEDGTGEVPADLTGRLEDFGRFVEAGAAGSKWGGLAG